MRGNSRWAAFKAGVLAPAAAAASLAFLFTGLLRAPDTFFYDSFHGLSGKRYEPGGTVIVSIDERALAEFGDEPMVFWGPHFALAIETLRGAGVAAVGIDFLFSVSAESWLGKIGAVADGRSRTYDAPFREQLASGKVVLIGLLAGAGEGEGRLLLPISEYQIVLPGGAADVGLANLRTDADGVTRSYSAALFNDGTVPSLTFAALLAGKARGGAAKPRGAKGGAGGIVPELISFAGPPGTFERIDFRRLLEPGAARSPELARLKGKTAIIAAENIGSQDLHLTPYSVGLGSGPRLMSGAEVHANIVETILSGGGPRQVPGWVEVLFALAAATAGTAVLFRFGPWRGLYGAAFLSAAFLSVSYASFRCGTVVSATTPLLTLAFCWLGTIARSLTRKERERARMAEMFGRYISDEVLEKLLSSGIRPDLGGEEAHVTVLFSDIRNFTTISERLKPNEVVEMLNAYFGRAVEPILAQGGTVDKFIGDAVMAVFGTPVPYADHARRAVVAAVGVSEAADGFKAWMRERFAGRDLPDFKVGVGLHTGVVISGNVGSLKKMQFTAIGDAVNTASRLEGKTKETGTVILASAETVSAAGPVVKVGRKFTLQVKGRERPVEACEVLGLEGR